LLPNAPERGSSTPEEETNVWSLITFALVGLLTGAAARLWYPGREPLRVLGTMVLGMVGALLGGLVSLAEWQSVEGQVHVGALLTSLLGAVLVLVTWAVVAYARSVSERAT
jgi:uncharacterized membrane protein YeaQ/YmgE (transglycosylase-associated protein family)